MRGRGKHAIHTIALNGTGDALLVDDGEYPVWQPACAPPCGRLEGPPAVPDGSSGTPLLVEKLLPDGARLLLYWDEQTCAGTWDHHVLYGRAGSLPTFPGGIYLPDRARCESSIASPFYWTAIPSHDPAPDYLWFLVVTRDAAGQEGSWGPDGSGNEREGPGPGGASVECGVTDKSLVNTCGQGARSQHGEPGRPGSSASRRERGRRGGSCAHNAASTARLTSSASSRARARSRSWSLEQGSSGQWRGGPSGEPRGRGCAAEAPRDC